VRPARAGDAASLARVQVASWRRDLAGIVPSALLAELTSDEAEGVWRDRWREAITNPPTSRHHVLAAVTEGRRVQIFGDDYPTPDGTCIRDYIHVTDLADAHLRALGACRAGQHRVYNLGNGAGFSVREVIEVCREVTGRDIATDVTGRRAGDPAVLVASSAKIQSDLGWRASRDLRAMAADAWQFTQARTPR